MAIAVIYERDLSVERLTDLIAKTWGVGVDMGPSSRIDQLSFSTFTPADPSTYIGNLKAVQSTLESYSPDLVKSLNIDSIKFGDSLVKRKHSDKSDYPIAGSVDTLRGVVYACTNDFVEETLHHEIGHLILDRSDPDLVDDIYEYLDCINSNNNLSYQRRRYNFFNPIKGFVNYYAASDIEEDIPETLALLMSDPFEIFDLAKDDRALAEKIDLTLNVLDIVSNGAMGAQWQKSLRNFRRFPMYEMLS